MKLDQANCENKANLVEMVSEKSKFVPAIKTAEHNNENTGLCNRRVFIFLGVWYIFSFFTLFMNKYIMSTLQGEPTVVGAMQMVMAITLGYFQMHVPLGFYKKVDRQGKPPNFWMNMLIVGTMRFSSVVFGLIALKFVAVSFIETVKSSAPMFTVGISYIMLREYTGMWTIMSLIPIMLGLGLCSAYELSFNLQGFLMALATNISECLGDVYSKKLISSDISKYTPAELQFFTSISSVIVQIPVCLILIDFPQAQKSFDLTMFFALVANGVCFHFQSICAYVLLGYISPVTYSVSNTVKRAFLIWSSVIVFGNPVTFLSGLGTIFVTLGVLCYTKAKQYDTVWLLLNLSSDSQVIVAKNKLKQNGTSYNKKTIV